MNIRKEGSYEIVLYGNDFKRLDEVVTQTSLHETEAYAEVLLEAVPEAESYTISKILTNSAYGVWSGGHVAEA